MAKDKEHEGSNEQPRAALPKSEPMPPTGCVVCGSYDGLPKTTSPAPRWHDFCADARPDVIAKVKARA